jgi:hypothetical protein
MQLVIKDKTGQVINIGPWDYKMALVMGDDLERPILNRHGDTIGYEQKQVGEVPTNPLPDGAYEDQAEVIDGADGGKYASCDYRALRRDAYPSIGDQLDALYHAGLMPPDMAAKIAAVKARYPKSGT